MTPSHAACQQISDRFAELRVQYLFTDLGYTDKCLTQKELVAAAQSPLEQLAAATQHHLQKCSRCAHTFLSFRASHLSALLPDTWEVALQVNDRQTRACLQDGPLFLRVNLETRQVDSFADASDFTSSPLHILIVLVVDAATDVISLSVQDAPTFIRALGISTPRSSRTIVSDEEPNAFEFVSLLTEFCATEDSSKAAALLDEWISTGQLRIVFSADASSPQRVYSLLNQAGAIERDFDYQLPTGLHTDTHINISKLCRTESTLQGIATAFDVLLKDSTFDTIVTNGWAMAAIARRLLIRRYQGLPGASGQVVICEGYHSPSPIGDLSPGNRVLIMTDVTITGGLIKRLRPVVESSGAKVAAIACLARATTGSELPAGVRALCSIPMTLRDPWVESTVSAHKELRVFNPVSGAMTRRAPSPRSPSEFLEYDEQARQFWEFVDRTGAYQHHHREGDTHYIAFVDTKRLLASPDVASELASRLRDKILIQVKTPDVLVVVDRVRSRLFAQALFASFREHGAMGETPSLVIAVSSGRRKRKVSPLDWQIPLQHRRAFRGARVLIVDAAAGHGTTIDQLCQAVNALEPATIGAAVLLSRLTEGCEDAFNARLSGGFHSLFRLPIRPIIIRGNHRDLCPVCRRKAALKAVGEDSGVEAVRLWAEHVTRRRWHSVSSELRTPVRETQLSLFKLGDEFLRGCRESVASGVTLHALNAAMTNGMAPLSLPELLNERIPSQNRAAMVQNLPQAALEWSGDPLAHDLITFLEKRASANIWRATAEALARHGSVAWVQHISGFVEKAWLKKTRISPSFWNHVACSAYLTAAANPQEKHTVRKRFEELLSSAQGTPFVEGLQRVLDTIGR